MILKGGDLVPFEIHFDGKSYTVLEDTGRLDKDGEIVFKTHGYHSTRDSAFNKIRQLKVDYPNVVYSLNSYMKALKDMTDKITKVWG